MGLTDINFSKVDYDNVAGPSGSSPRHSPPLPELLPHSPVAAVRSARSGRAIRMPNRYIDYLPGSATHLEHMPPTRQQARGRRLAQADEPIAEHEAPQIKDNDDACPLLIPSETEPDSMGLYRIYCTHPTLIPKGEGALDNVCDTPTLDAAGNTAEQVSQSLTGVPLPPPEITCHNLYDAFSSPTAGLMMCWHFSGSTAKSTAETHRLMKFLDNNKYKREDARIFNIPREKKLLEDYLTDTSNPFRAENGWQKSSVKIPLPKEKVKWPSEDAAPQLEIEGVHHRSLTSIITSVFEDSVSSTFHMTPYQQMWETSDGRKIEIFSEAYSSIAMREAYAKVHSLPRAADDNLERVVASLMMWSDATHLASFGDASLWPFYLFFGNQSKYTRGKPTASACHHVAYIPTVHCVSLDLYMR